MDRLGGDIRDLCNLVDEITGKGAVVEFVNENITVDRSGASPMNSLMLGILAAFAEFERRRIKERQGRRHRYRQSPRHIRPTAQTQPQDVEQA